MREGSRIIGVLLILIIISASAAGVATYYLSRREAQAVVQTSTITLTKTVTETIIATTTETVRETIAVTTTVTPLDSDGDGIPDLKEIEYGTDPHKPNYLLFYALKKLPENEALKFKNVENFDEYSVGLVNLYASLPHDKRVSEEVNDLLNRILLDNKVDWLEKNLFDDMFVNPSQPSIFNFNWMPVRENLDKIYDIKVTFIARDDKTPISYAKLHFIPVEYYYMIGKYGMRPENYSRVFPPDKERVFILTPVDGKFDSLEENFSVTIKDIVGGREYKIVILVKDTAGNEKTIEVKLPYIRQYENLGKLLYEKGFIVMSVYLPFNMRNIPHKDDVSLLGKYDTLDEIIVAKHVDWATGYGINTFILDSQNHWWSTTDMRYRVFLICRTLLSLNQINVAWLMGPSRKHFVYGVYGGEIPEWAIDLRKPWNNKTFIEFVDALMSPEIVNNPNYLRINGKPVLYIWDEGAFFNQEETYIAVKRLIAERTGSKAYIIAEWIPRIPTQPSDEYVQFLLEKFRGAGLRVVDAFTGWIGLHRVGLDTQEYVDNYEYYYDIQLNAWKNFTRTWGKDFIVTLTPGFDNSYSWGGPQIPLPRDINKFTERLKIAIRYLDNTRPALKIDTWNDFGEWTYIEPTRKDGFTYLEILRSILVNLATDKNPPLIHSLNWAPTRVVLDKIYDINVTFTAIDDENPIAYAELRFIPVEYYYMVQKYGMRLEDYPKVFPSDKERVFVPTPTDGKFDELEEEFSALITNIVGGREYRIVALVRDVAGNERIVEIKTPYIRQFENVAKTDDIIVAVPYYLWYRRDLSNWKDGHKYMPLLGEYRSDDPIVMSKHIDWATGYGIGVFLISWSGYESGDLKYFDENLKLLLKNPLSKDIKLGILYESIGRLKNSNPGWNLSNPENIEILDRDFSYLSKNYFNHPSCFKVNGKPLIYFYEGKGVFGDVSQIKKLREKYRIFLVSDHGHPRANPTDVFPAGHPQAVVWGEAAKMFNGITSWLGGYDPNGNYLGDSYENQIKIGFSKWESWTIENERKFIPSITPEFDNRYVKWGNPNSIPLHRSPELFIERLKIALNHIKTSKLLMIGTWNDFFESTTLEPSREYGFTYLELIKSNK